MAVELTPYCGELELGDERFAGQFAGELVKMAQSAEGPPWCTYIARRDGIAVGSGGFKTPPDADNAVEIGYLTFTPARQSGVATELAAALVAIAAGQGVAVVVAHTLPEANPSTRVLEANGFLKAGEIDDPEDGPIWRWKLALAIDDS